MSRYILSVEAESDLERLLEFGIDTFGETAAIAYFDGLVERFESISKSPLQYPEASNIRDGYRLSVYKSHSVYFRSASGVVEIIRILTGQDIEAALERAGVS